MLSQDTDSSIENRDRSTRVRLPAALRRELERRAREEGESLSSVVRRALRRELEAESR